MKRKILKPFTNKNHKAMIKAFFILMLFVLAACKSPTTATSVTKVITPKLSNTMTPHPTEIAILSAMDVKNTQIVINNVTREWRSGTATLTQTPTPLIWPTLTASPTPTAGFEDFYRDSSLSPDGQWTAMAYQSYINGQTRLFLFVERLDGTIKWEVDNVEYIDAYYPVPYLWSSDGRYFYFTYHRAGDGCWPSFSNGLKRVDLLTGEVKTIFDDSVLKITFSPNERYVAIFVNSSLRIIDINTDQIFDVNYSSTSEGNYLVNDIVWSPNGRSIIFAAMYQPCVQDQPVTIVRVDLEDRAQTILLENDPHHNLHIDEWIDADRILLSDFISNKWYLNPFTGQLTEIFPSPPTPSPTPTQ